MHIVINESIPKKQDNFVVKYSNSLIGQLLSVSVLYLTGRTTVLSEIS